VGQQSRRNRGRGRETAVQKERRGQTHKKKRGEKNSGAKIEKKCINEAAEITAKRSIRVS